MPVETVIAQLRVAAGRLVAGFNLIGRGVGLVNVSPPCLELGDNILVDVAALRLPVRLVRSANLYASSQLMPSHLRASSSWW